MSDSLLEIRNLTKRYGENTVLRDLRKYSKNASTSNPFQMFLFYH